VITPASLQRREYKYLVDEATVERIRHNIAGFCAVDDYATATGRYWIDTLYLDTPWLDAYRAVADDVRDRWKLRVRGYPGAVDSPVFLEVKRRIDETVHKTRGAFRGDWARLVERGDPEILAMVGSKQRAPIDNFICRYHYAPMRPVALVRYEREPYFSLVDDYARVTFDRNLQFQHAWDHSLAPPHEHWTFGDNATSQRGVAVQSSMVLLELKFTTVVPAWMRRMVHTLDLQRLSFCKYTRAIEALRIRPEPRVARAGFWR
jgi:hypothetical protein